MGLEIAELMLEVEERYAIEIGEDDVKDIQTFGDLADMVKRKIDEPLRPDIEESSYEIILASFLAELRSLLPMEMNIDERTKLKELKPFVKQRDIWSSVQERFPELSSDGKPPRYYEDNLSCAGFLCAEALWLAIVIFLCNKFFADIYALYAFVFCVGLPIVWRISSIVRRRARTVGDVAGEIAEKRRKRFRASRLSIGEVENELRTYLCEAFGFQNPDDIRRESDLDKDLRLG